MEHHEIWIDTKRPTAHYEHSHETYQYGNLSRMQYKALEDISKRTGLNYYDLLRTFNAYKMKVRRLKELLFHSFENYPHEFSDIIRRRMIERHRYYDNKLKQLVK